MKTKNIFAFAALGLLSLSACSNDKEDLVWQGSEVIEIAPSIGAMQARVTGTAFEANDAISLYGWTGSAEVVNAESLVVKNAKYTYDGTTWSTTDHALWRDKKTAHYFVGVYPQRAVEDLTADNFTYTGTEDLMIANNMQGVTYGPAVTLNFKHALAKLKMTCKFTNEFSTAAVEKITVESKDNATVNYLTNVFTPTGEASEQTTTQVDNAFETVLIPQEGAKVRIYLGKNGIYEYALNASTPLESGKVTTINFKIGKDILGVSNVQLTPWTEKSVNDNDIAQDVTSKVPEVDSTTHTITMQGVGGLTIEILKSAGTPDGGMLKIVGEVNDADIKTMQDFQPKQSIGFDLSGVTSIYDMKWHPVNRLANGAFSVNSSLSSIILPEVITSIPPFCFSNSNGLKKIVFKGDIKYIDKDGFSYIPNAVTIDFSACTAVPTVESNLSISEGTTILVGNESLIDGFKNIFEPQPTVKVKDAQ